MKIFVYIMFLCLCTVSTFSQYRQGIDTVYSFTPGEGQNIGQDEQYFPENIYGLPDTSASLYYQSALPENVCSLGFGGEIVIGFRNYVVFDGPGADFTIFENAFLNPVTDKIFAEPARISVSKDGLEYFDFPFDSLTLFGCAGVTPTYGNKDPFDPDSSGGDHFDIAIFGLDYIKYIKIKDISRMILDNPEHPYYDPVITGFDLDAIVGLNLRLDNTGLRNELSNKISIISNIERSVIIRNNDSGKNFSLMIFGYDGRLLEKAETINTYIFDAGKYGDRIFMLLLNVDGSIQTCKLAL